MSLPPSIETDVERGRRLGRKYTIVVFSVLACSFMATTTLQIIFGVFGVGARPITKMESSGQTSCAERLRAMEAAVERAVAASARAPDRGVASTRYESALGPEWDDVSSVESLCASEGRGATDALAAVVRLRTMGEELARAHAVELAPLRRDVAAYLPE
jgi:hypothetical protein